MTRTPPIAALAVVFFGCQGSDGDKVEACDFDIDVSETDRPGAVTLSWTTSDDVTATVEYGVDGEYDTTIDASTTATTDHSVTLLGMLAATDISYRLEMSDGESCEGSFTTENLPSELPSIEVMLYNDAIASPEPYLLGVAMSGFGQCAPYVIDRDGEWRWYALEEETYQVGQAQFAVGTNEVLYNRFDAKRQEDLATIERYDLDGELTGSLDTPWAHHFFYQHEDGAIAFLGVDVRPWLDTDEGETVDVAGDTLMVLDAEGNLTEIINLWDHFDVEKGPHWDEDFYHNSKDWTHANAVDYDAETDSYLMSLGGLSRIIQVSSAGEILDIIDDSTYTFVTSQSPMTYPHDVHWTEDGTMMMISHSETGTAAVEWDVDQSAKVMTEVWSYNDGRISTSLGQARELSNGNVMVNYGGMGVIREVTREGEIAWEIQSALGYFFGNGQFFSDFYTGE